MFNKQVCFLCTWERPRKTATSRNGLSYRLQHHLSGGQGEMVGCGASRGRGPGGAVREGAPPQIRVHARGVRVGKSFQGPGTPFPGAGTGSPSQTEMPLAKA